MATPVAHTQAPKGTTCLTPSLVMMVTEPSPTEARRVLSSSLMPERGKCRHRHRLKMGAVRHSLPPLALYKEHGGAPSKHTHIYNIYTHIYIHIFPLFLFRFSPGLLTVEGMGFIPERLLMMMMMTGLLSSFNGGYIHLVSWDWVGWRSRECMSRTEGTQSPGPGKAYHEGIYIP